MGPLNTWLLCSNPWVFSVDWISLSLAPSCYHCHKLSLLTPFSKISASYTFEIANLIRSQTVQDASPGRRTFRSRWDQGLRTSPPSCGRALLIPDTQCSMGRTCHSGHLQTLWKPESLAVSNQRRVKYNALLCHRKVPQYKSVEALHHGSLLTICTGSTLWQPNNNLT